MSYQLAREYRYEVVCYTGEYGDASIEVSADVRDSLVLVLPLGDHDVSILTPEKALELAGVLVDAAGAALGAGALSTGRERHQLVRVAQAVDNLLRTRVSGLTPL